MTELAEQIEEDFEVEAEETELEAEDAEMADEAEGEGEDAEDEEVVISINGEAPAPEEDEEARAPDWVRDLRKQYREEKRRAKELEQRLAQVEQRNTPGVAPLGPKPTLEKVDYDTDRYETALEAWYAQKATADKAEREAQRQAEEAQKAWQAKLDGYGKAKADLKVRDYDEAEHTVMETLNVTQQGVVLQGATNPALVVYALGKNPKRAKELAAITDPVRFAFAVAKLEAQLKVTPRTKPPAPERRAYVDVPAPAERDLSQRPHPDRAGRVFENKTIDALIHTRSSSVPPQRQCTGCRSLPWAGHGRRTILQHPAPRAVRASGRVRLCCRPGSHNARNTRRQKPCRRKRAAGPLPNTGRYNPAYGPGCAGQQNPRSCHPQKG